MRQENCLSHLTCLLIAFARTMRIVRGNTHYIHHLNYRKAVGHILKVKYLIDILSSMRKYILCLAFFADRVYAEGSLQVPGDGETQKPEGFHGRHDVVVGGDTVRLHLQPYILFVTAS